MRDLIEYHKLIRRAILVWWVVLSTVSVFWGLWNLLSLTMPQATFLTAILGMGSVITGFYFQTRGKQDVADT